jgi:hypothetical protein
MPDNPYFENLFPLEDDEELPFYAMRQSGKSEEFLNSLLDSICDDLFTPKTSWHFKADTWDVYVDTLLSWHMVVIKLYNQLIIPIYEDENYSNTISMALFAAAAMKKGYAKKLTNILTGDIINIEIKNYGEEIDEDL